MEEEEQEEAVVDGEGVAEDGEEVVEEGEAAVAEEEVVEKVGPHRGRGYWLMALKCRQMPLN